VDGDPKCPTGQGRTLFRPAWFYHQPRFYPSICFLQGEARWLRVQQQGEAEQPRIMLLSLPYALKAGGAATVGSSPASAFVLAVPPNSTPVAPTIDIVTGTEASGSIASPGSSNVTTTRDTPKTILLFTTAADSKFDSDGGRELGGKLNLPATGTATSSKPFNSQREDLVASPFNGATNSRRADVLADLAYRANVWCNAEAAQVSRGKRSNACGSWARSSGRKFRAAKPPR